MNKLYLRYHLNNILNNDYMPLNIFDVSKYEPSLKFKKGESFTELQIQPKGILYHLIFSLSTPGRCVEV